MTLLVVVVVIGLQTVGVVLMVATLITPAAAARQWTDRLGMIVVIAARSARSPVLPEPCFRCARCACRPVRSSCSPHSRCSRSPCSSRRGAGCFPAARFLRLRARVAAENVLRSLYESIEREGPWDRRVPLAEIAARRGGSEQSLAPPARALTQRGLRRARRAAAGRVHAAWIGDAHRVVRNYRFGRCS